MDNSHCFSLSLREFGSKAFSKDGVSCKIVIPSIQRGLVWNAVRAEILWDSILRGMPIGTINLMQYDEAGSHTAKNEYKLMDGQQRQHAIAMAFGDYWEANKDPNADNSVLWIDLSGKVQDGIERKYLFRVTTAAHPWGYELTNKEDQDNNPGLQTWEFRVAVEKLNGCWNNSSMSGARPYPNEIWPQKPSLNKGHCFVPFSLFREYLDTLKDVVENPLAGFIAWFDEASSNRNCKDSYGNWRKFLAENLCEDVEETARKIAQVIKMTMNNYFVVAIDVTGRFHADDVALYFKRMNVQGKEMDSWEIQYSQLKHRIPGLKKIEQVAPFVHPVTLAHAVMEFWGKWCTGKNVQKIDELVDSTNPREMAFKDVSFKQYLIGNFPGCNLNESLKWIIDTLKNGGLSRWHISTFLNESSGRILYFMLRLAQMEQKVEPKTCCALVTCISWCGGNNLDATVDNVLNSRGAYGKALLGSVSNGNLFMPTLPCEIEWMQKDELATKERLQAFESNDANAAIKRHVDKWWNPFAANNTARGLLLLACQEYLAAEYQFEYDPSAREWQEQNTPWDYDHILPKIWLDHISSTDVNILRRIVNSVGNAAPVPYQVNRSKSADAPGRNYPFGNREHPHLGEDNGAYLNVDGIEKVIRQSNEGWLSPENETKFVSMTLHRLYDIYMHWWTTFGIGELLASGIDHNRSKKIVDFYLGVRAHFKDEDKCRVEMVYLPAGEWSDGRTHDTREYAIRNELGDGGLLFAYPYVSVGVRVGQLFACVTFGPLLEIGMRKLPETYGISPSYIKENNIEDKLKTFREIGYSFIGNGGHWCLYKNVNDSQCMDLLIKELLELTQVRID